LVIDPVLPAPYDSPFHWVKADMTYTVSFSRLSAMCVGRDAQGQRLYDNRVISPDQLVAVQKALLHGIGLGPLTLHL
jgi:mRNA interferase MazF